MEEKTTKNKDLIKYIILLVCLYCFTFQNFITIYIPTFTYFDELYAIISLPLLVIEILKKKGKILINKNYRNIVICIVLLILVGVYSNITYKYQPVNIVLSDLLVTVKFVLAILTTKYLFKESNIESYKDKLYNHIKIITIFMFVLSILNYLFNIFSNMHEVTYRYGILVNQLFYTHPTNFVATCIFLIAMLLFCVSNKKHKNQWIYFTLIILMIASTLRSKAIGFVFIFFILYFVIIAKKKRITVLKIGVIGMLLLLIGSKQIMYYFVELEDTAREKLLETSIEIAEDYFPIGTGFGTFGSYFSAENYSPVYKMYNIDKIYGLEEGKAYFVSDSFWPMILGQFGIIGTVLFILIISYIIIEIQKLYKYSEYYYCSAMLSIMYLLIASIAESAFANPVALPLMLVISLNLTQYERRKYEKEKINNVTLTY